MMDRGYPGAVLKMGKVGIHNIATNIRNQETKYGKNKVVPARIGVP